MKKLLGVIFLFCFLFGVMPNIQAASFKDINKSSSFLVEIEYLANKDIIKGYQDGTFKPNELITKKHIAALLVRSLNLPMKDLKDPQYKDIPKSHPYYKEIAAAHNAGLFPDGTYFYPESSITRGLMAHLIAKAFHLEILTGAEEDVDSNLSDVSRNSEYYSDILKVVSNNVARGYDDGTFKPNKSITRGQFAAFLTRALTIREMNILPDSKYVYYYSDGNSTYRYEYDRKEDNGLEYWKITDQVEGEPIPRLGFIQTNIFYGEAYEDWYHFDMIIPYPFVVSQIHRKDDEGPVSYGDSWIISTNSVRTVHNVEYQDVLAIKSYLPWSNSTVYFYYAKDVGLIQQVDKYGNELFGLVKRELKENK